MGYIKIPNLYKDKRILEFKRVYALEKIDGSWWSIKNKDGNFHITIRGIDRRLGLMAFSDIEGLQQRISQYNDIIIFGEGYGGKIQGMSETYGDEVRFVAFDVRIGEHKLSVPDAHEVCKQLEIDFVPYEMIDTDIESLDAARQKPSEQAVKNGISGNKMREGIILRPPFEVRLNNGGHLVAKYKNEKFRETRSPRKLTEQELKVLSEAQQVADEWVTLERLRHVASDLQLEPDIEYISLFIDRMTKDIESESEGEIVWSKSVRKAISKKTAEMIKDLCQNKLYAK